MLCSTLIRYYALEHRQEKAHRVSGGLAGLVQVVALDHSLRSTLGWFGVARIARANSNLKPMLRRYAAAARVPRELAIWSARAL